MSPKKLRLLVAASALLFLLAGAAIGTMLGMQGDDGAKGPPPMTERDAMVPGYARRVPVLKLRRFDAGVKKD